MSRFDAAITFCPTPDLGATARFYEDVLGLTLALDQGTCRIYRIAGGGFLGFCRSDDPPITRGLILTLVTDDVDGWESRLRAADVEIEAPATLNPTYNIYHVFCRDPNGYRVEIQRFEDERWKKVAS